MIGQFDFVTEFWAAILAATGTILVLLGIFRKPVVRFLESLFVWWVRPIAPVRYLASQFFSSRVRRSNLPIELRTAILAKNEETIFGSSPLFNVLSNQIKAKRSILVLGRPGSGKTTTLEFISTSLARSALLAIAAASMVFLILIVAASIYASPIALWALVALPSIGVVYRLAPIPIYVRLTDLESRSPEELIIDKLESCTGGTLVAKSVKQFASRGSVVLILDGLNEISRDYYQWGLARCSKLTDTGSHFASSAIILSSRTGEDDPGDIGVDSKVAVCDLDDRGVRILMSFYGSSDVENDYQVMTEKGLLSGSGLGRNPYWLRLMVEQARYTKNLGALFEGSTRRVLRKESSIHHKALEKRLDAWGYVGWAMTQLGGIGLPVRDATAILEQLGFDSEQEIRIAQDAKLIRDFTFRDQRLEFSHPLLQEYFTAYAFRNDPTKILDYLDDFRVWGAIIMLAGLIDDHEVDGQFQFGDRRQFEEFVDRILSNPESAEYLLLTVALLCCIDNPTRNLEERVFQIVADGLVLAQSSKRQIAAVELARIAGDNVVERIGSYVLSSADTSARLAMLSVIADVNSVKARSLLVSALQVPDLEYTAQKKLASFGSSIVGELLGHFDGLDDAGRSSITRTIAKIGEPAIVVLVQTLCDQHSNRHAAAIAACQLLGDLAAGPLIDLFRSLDSEVRRRAQEALVGIGSLAIPALVGALQKGDPLIKAGAIEVLAKVQDGAANALIEAWSSSRGERMGLPEQAAFIEVLGRIGDPVAEGVLNEAANVANDGIRIKAEIALAKISGIQSKENAITSTRSRRAYSVVPLLALVEFLVVGLSYALASVMLNSPVVGGKGLGSLPVSTFAYAALVFLTLVSMGLYQSSQRIYMYGVVARILVATLLASIGLQLLSRTSPLGGGTVLALSSAISFLGLIGTRAWYIRNFDHSIFKRRIIVYGVGARASSINDLRRRWDRRSFDLLGSIAPANSETVVANVVATTDSMVDFVENNDVDEIVVAQDDPQADLPLLELMKCKRLGVEIIEIGLFIERQTGTVPIELLTPSQIIMSGRSTDSLLQQLSSRAFDLIVSTIFLLCSAPFMLLCAIAIKIEAGFRDPVIYRQIRVGLNGRVFSLYKFRTMRIDAEAIGRANWASASDTRVTRVGAVLRKFGFDELPQIFNVLRGSMAIVGPTPERPEFASQLEARIPYYAERVAVRPGITGWAQLTYAYGASEQDAIEKLKRDLYYIKNKSLLLDILIILQTVEVVLWGKGAR